MVHGVVLMALFMFTKAILEGKKILFITTVIIKEISPILMILLKFSQSNRSASFTNPGGWN